MGHDPRIGIVRVELTHVHNGTARILDDTLAVFRDASARLIDVVLKHPEVLDMGSMGSLTEMERLCHHTKENPDPEIQDFDLRFPKFPSYMRRAAIHFAVGHVQSHETRCIQYQEERQKLVDRGVHYKKMEPLFSFTPNACPTLYRKNAVDVDLSSGTVRVKCFVRNTWDWITVGIPNRDKKNLERAVASGTVMNPKLIHEYHKYYLEFPVTYKCARMPDVPLDERVVLAVDRGLNHGAVCSAVTASGTVHGRYFDPFKADMDRISHIIGLIRKAASQSGKGQSLASLYTKLQGLKENYACQLARWIVNRAVECNAYGIVLEHLEGIRGKRKGLKARIHHWCTAKIRDYIKGMAFRAGIRTFIISPKGTSMYAFDGSGKVTRDNNNFSICTFANGKRYNCDLSASYNIAARYFLREYKKSIPATEWSELMAKVPGLSKGTTWTLSTLRDLSAAVS